MHTDTFKILRTSELPDGSRAWIAIAVHNREEKNSLVWEVHVITRSDIDPNVFSTEHPSDTPVEARDTDENEKQLKQAAEWARQHIAQRWAKHEDFTGVTLSEIEPKALFEARFLRDLPDKFADVARFTYSKALKEWLTELNTVPQHAI